LPPSRRRFKISQTLTHTTMADITVSADIDTLMQAASFAAGRTSQGVGTGDSPQFAAVNIGAATDTTVTRVSAGIIAVEGATVYTQGGALGTPASGTLSNCTTATQSAGDSTTKLASTAFVQGAVGTIVQDTATGDGSTVAFT